MYHVTRKIQRPSPATVAAIARHSVATLHEAQGRTGALDPRIKPVDAAMSLCGPAFTVRCAPRDNIMLQLAIHYAEPGDVIVCAAGEYPDAGFFGDVLGNACKAKRLGGLVIDSGVRDTADLRKLGFPVFSLAISVKGTVKETIGPINQPVVIGGELVRPGDIVRGDADGVVVVRREEAERVAPLAKVREEAENDLIARYKAGETVMELCKLGPIIMAKGLTVEPL